MSGKIYTLGDVLDVMVRDFFSPPANLITSRSLRIVDEDDYDIVPRKKLIERQIKEAEQHLKSLQDQKSRQERWYDEQIKEASLKLDQLKQKLPTQ